MLVGVPLKKEEEKVKSVGKLQYRDFKAKPIPT